jgi:hypothetical protein
MLHARYFAASEPSVIFDADDFHCSIMEAVDSDDTVRAIMDFLTLCPGDVGASYFKDYTPQQIVWRDTHARDLQEYMTLNWRGGHPDP